MSRRCDICGKGIQFGSMISHAHNVSKRRWQPNLQRVRVVIDGVPQRIKVCTGCLRSDVVQKAIRSTAKTPAQKETPES